MAYKKDTVKLGRSAYITILCVLAAILVSVLLLLPSEKERIYNAYKSNTSLTKDHVFDSISYSEFKSKIKKESYTYVYLATPSNEESVTDISIVDAKAKEAGISKVYYLNSAKLSDKQMGNILTMLQGLDGMKDVLEDIDDIVVPDVLVFKDGKLMNSFQKYKITSLSSLHSWTDEQIILNQIFKFNK